VEEQAVIKMQKNRVPCRFIKGMYQTERLLILADFIHQSILEGFLDQT
jgi:hypothetical protein